MCSRIYKAIAIAMDLIAELNHNGTYTAALSTSQGIVAAVDLATAFVA